MQCLCGQALRPDLLPRKQSGLLVARGESAGTVRFVCRSCGRIQGVNSEREVPAEWCFVTLEAAVSA